MNKKILIAVIAIIIIICAGAFALINMQAGNGASINVDANALEDKGNLVVDSEEISAENGLYSSSSSDENAVLVKNNGVLKLANSIINKTGDTSTTGDDADFYGINSAILVNTNGSLDISNVKITTNSKGSNGIFVTNAESSGSSSSNVALDGNGLAESSSGSGSDSSNGGTPPSMPSSGTGSDGGTPPEMSDSNGGSEGGDSSSMAASNQDSVDGTTEANIENVEITTYSDKSRGLDATYNGIINAKNVIINTNGQSCAALATDRGEGEVHVTNSELNTGVSKQSGRGSPIIYSTGNITVANSIGTAYVSQIACIEGKNSIELSNCDLSAAAGGNRQDNGDYVDLGGVFIYQSMSGDADVGTSTFTAKDSVLSILSDSDCYESAPMFHVTNTKAIINLEKTELNFGSGTLLDVSGQSQWGTVGSNGGELTFNAKDETLDGNIIVDSISSLNMTLSSTSYVGAINPSDDFGQTAVIIESGSDWTLDGDSHISSLENNGEINYNGHTLYVNGVAYTESNPYN
ncbi:hypothetical protein [uncultured Methanobrevibacter sp.]|uniref:hypothetical protein n=1 Tax=uncultured Methanobrevibacter sp. TaxID=253161 RepID=UPI0025D46902|nr:hypothetical protein [uncultured Methanobrevibacter sp.]